VGLLVIERLSNVLNIRLTPPCRRLTAVEGFVLLVIEQIEQCAINARKALEIAHRAGVVIDAPDAAKSGFHVANSSIAFIEALRSATNPCKKVAMSNLAVFSELRLHNASMAVDF
jgi:hypothetical protein